MDGREKYSGGARRWVSYCVISGLWRKKVSMLDYGNYFKGILRSKDIMNIQIFGTKKNFDVKKAERFFKERGVKYQFVDMKEKGMSKGEFNSVCQAVGGYEKLIDDKCKDKDLLALIKYIAEEDKCEKILENQKVIKIPIVRNGKQATVGYEPEVWKNWK